MEKTGGLNHKSGTVLKTFSLSWLSPWRPVHVLEHLFSNSVELDRRTLPCLTPPLAMRNLLLVSTYLVTIISQTRTTHQAITSSSSGSTKPLSCYSLSQEVVDPVYGDSFGDSVNQLDSGACQPNVNEANQASAICLAHDWLDSGFQQISIDSLVSECCERNAKCSHML